MNTMLMLFLVGATGLNPIWVQPYPNREACEAAKIEAVKQVPTDAQINYVAVCARVRNATEARV